MLIFWRLMLGHLLADFTLQTDLINAWKRRSTWGMLVHCAMHPILYAALTFPYLNDYWVQTQWIDLKGWTCVFILFVLHFIEDEWRVFMIRKLQFTDNTLFFLWDQLVHYACIFILFPIGLFDLSQGWIPEKWTVLACLFVMVTHYSTVVVYFIEKDLYGASFPDFDEKYMGMAGRMVLALCFLLPGPWWLILSAAWLGVVFYLRARQLIDFTWFSLYAGSFLGVLCGVGARAVYYL